MTIHPIEAVIFDLGRVLVAIDNRLLVERLFKGMDPADSQQVARRTMADPAMVAFNSGQIARRNFLSGCGRPAGCKLIMTRSAACGAASFTRWRAWRNW
jgi:hypothetical protein